MQSLLTSFFVSNQIYIVVALLVIGSVYIFRYMVRHFKVTINLKKLMYDSPNLKVNTLFTSINENHQIKLINKLIDQKIIDRKDYEKAISISKSMLPVKIPSKIPSKVSKPTVSQSTVSSPGVLQLAISPASVSPVSVSPPSVSPVSVSPQSASPPSVSPQSASPPSVSPQSASPPLVSPQSASQPSTSQSTTTVLSPTVTSTNK